MGNGCEEAEDRVRVYSFWRTQTAEGIYDGGRCIRVSMAARDDLMVKTQFYSDVNLVVYEIHKYLLGLSMERKEGKDNKDKDKKQFAEKTKKAVFDSIEGVKLTDLKEGLVSTVRYVIDGEVRYETVMIKNHSDLKYERFDNEEDAIRLHYVCAIRLKMEGES